MICASSSQVTTELQMSTWANVSVEVFSEVIDIIFLSGLQKFKPPRISTPGVLPIAFPVFLHWKSSFRVASAHSITGLFLALTPCQVYRRKSGSISANRDPAFE